MVREGAFAVLESCLIKLHRVTKTYDVAACKFIVLKEVDMQVDEGEFVALIGQSGGGKPTLSNMLSGDFAVLQLNDNTVQDLRTTGKDQSK